MYKVIYGVNARKTVQCNAQLDDRVRDLPWTGIFKSLQMAILKKSNWFSDQSLGISNLLFTALSLWCKFPIPTTLASHSDTKHSITQQNYKEHCTSRLACVWWYRRLGGEDW